MAVSFNLIFVLIRVIGVTGGYPVFVFLRDSVSPW
jgi:hypothetical protein